MATYIPFSFKGRLTAKETLSNEALARHIVDTPVLAQHSEAYYKTLDVLIELKDAGDMSERIFTVAALSIRSKLIGETI